MFIRTWLWSNNSGKRRRKLDGERRKLSSDGGLNKHPNILHRGTLQLKWPVRVLPPWAKMAKPLYHFISQSLNVACLRKSTALSKVAFRNSGEL